jgi:hypothetical protein
MAHEHDLLAAATAGPPPAIRHPAALARCAGAASRPPRRALARMRRRRRAHGPTDAGHACVAQRRAAGACCCLARAHPCGKGLRAQRWRCSPPPGASCGLRPHPVGTRQSPRARQTGGPGAGGARPVDWMQARRLGLTAGMQAPASWEARRPAWPAARACPADLGRVDVDGRHYHIRTLPMVKVMRDQPGMFMGQVRRAHGARRAACVQQGALHAMHRARRPYCARVPFIAPTSAGGRRLPVAAAAESPPKKPISFCNSGSSAGRSHSLHLPATCPAWHAPRRCQCSLGSRDQGQVALVEVALREACAMQGLSQLQAAQLAKREAQGEAKLAAH